MRPAPRVGETFVIDRGRPFERYGRVVADGGYGEARVELHSITEPNALCERTDVSSLDERITDISAAEYEAARARNWVPVIIPEPGDHFVEQDGERFVYVKILDPFAALVSAEERATMHAVAREEWWRDWEKRHGGLGWAIRFSVNQPAGVRDYFVLSDQANRPDVVARWIDKKTFSAARKRGWRSERTAPRFVTEAAIKFFDLLRRAESSDEWGEYAPTFDELLAQFGVDPKRLRQFLVAREAIQRAGEPLDLLVEIGVDAALERFAPEQKTTVPRATRSSRDNGTTREVQP